MSGTIPYQDSTAKAPLAELQRTLDKFGCSMFGTAKDTERGVTMVQFKWRNRQVSVEASWNGYAVALGKVRPCKIYGAQAKAEHHAKLLKQAQVSVECCLRDWIKGQTVAVECGVMSFEAAFMPHMLLPNGIRVIDHIQSTNLLPPPENAST